MITLNMRQKIALLPLIFLLVAFFIYFQKHYSLSKFKIATL